MTKFNQDAVYLLNRSTAEKIDAKMRTVRSGRKKYERSWIWELIQNAKDKATSDFPNKKVSIKIELSPEKLVFCHNYGYFTKSNVVGLIRQINSEDKDREDVLGKDDIVNTPIGRFGTGFMTTHLLSEKVSVNGLYKENDSFKWIGFSLDRSSQERIGLIQSVDTSFKEAEDSLAKSSNLSNPDFSSFNTKFCYHLEEGKSAIAETGLADLDSSLPYTLIFVEGIKDVIIEKGNDLIVFEKKEPKPLSNDITLIEIVKTVNGIRSSLNFIHLSKNLTAIALPVDLIEDKIQILPFPENLPMVFLHFPLVGTENFHFPVVVNNPFFEPTEPRDGIYLIDDAKDDKSITDQTFLLEASELFQLLLPFAIEKKWQNLFLLARTDIPTIGEEFFSKSWFKGSIQQPLRRILLPLELVQTETGRIPLESALFPYGQVSHLDRLWDLIFPLHGNKMPHKNTIHQWHTIIDSHWGKDLRFDLKKLVQEISGIGSIEKLIIRTGFTEQDTIQWLNQVIEFAIDLEESKLLNDYAITPNQNGIFKKKDDLWQDLTIPNPLKFVLKKLGKDWKDNLQHQAIHSHIPQIKKNQEDIIGMINNFIKNNPSNSLVKEAVLDLTSFMLPDSETSRISLWKFSSDFFEETPAKQTVEGFEKSAWEESDKWLVKTLCNQISSYQNVENLSLKLKTPAINWLHEFVIFLVKGGLGSMLNDYKLLPNQLGELKKKTELSLDNDIDSDLKEICEGLTKSLKINLLDKGIFLEIENRCISNEEVAKTISEKAIEIYQRDHGHNRSQEIKNLFEKLLKWMYDHGESSSKFLFKDLFERRNLVLRTDEENIQAIEFRQSILNNPNGYSEADVMKFINTRKEDFVAFTVDEFEKRVQEEVKKRLGATENVKDTDPNDLILNLGIASQEDLIKAMEKFDGTPIGLALQHYSSTADFSYVHGIIMRAKENVKSYLSTRPEYNISNWNEDSFTVISGVEKNGFPIKLVIRPSDGNQIIVWYPEEFEALEQRNSFAELWHDNDLHQGIYSFGSFLRKTKTNRLPV
jgi:hypothetical protein